MICLFTVSGVEAVTLAAQHTDTGSDRKTSGSVGSPVCVGTSPTGFQLPIILIQSSLGLHCKEKKICCGTIFLQFVNSFVKVHKALVDCYPFKAGSIL